MIESLFRMGGRIALLASAAALAGCASPTPSSAATAAGQAVSSKPPATETVASKPLVNVVYRKLENGLKVVLAPDPSVPTATVGVYYGVGWRVEPKDRTGYAHLFEHLMFQGSANLPKGAFNSLIEGNGGVLNGSTRWDYTNYYEVVPSHLAETVLWAEADRMKSLNLTPETLKNQQDVVISEVRVNVLNQPYGGFMWLDMPQAAFSNWYNAHNFYGDLDHLQAATLEDAKRFREQYYAPGNAVLVVAGDIDVEKTWAWAQKYFGTIAARPVGQMPDITEPEQTQEKVVHRTDPLAPRPALAFAYHVPPRGTPEWYAFGMIEALLQGGDDARLTQKLVREKGYTDSVMGGINPLLGDMFTYNGPMLMTFGLVHDASIAPEAIMRDVDTVINQLREQPVPQSELDRIRTRLRSGLYDMVGSSTRFSLMDLLASFALFDDNPAKVNTIEQGFAAVTPQLIQETARKYLAPTKRTVLILEPGAAAPAAKGEAK
ncbi:M16 family metallopeptidase [Pedomonas mirosovicensis]|uniref:M16 family metallopeptidase n=1 Tax=Pedomonas mirosovicensis TaxID=2908641 RepID=UPI00216A4ADD|nr:pitrilysin family protein [Pedomonas mirosovicensis]MCH8684162.1 insulinase family protein [Pedomonas mirosovicensis]